LFNYSPLFYYLLTTLIHQSLNTPLVSLRWCSWENEKEKNGSLNSQEIIHHWNLCFGGETWKWVSRNLRCVQY
jgi:hypothetical protein